MPLQIVIVWRASNEMLVKLNTASKKDHMKHGACREPRSGQVTNRGAKHVTTQPRLPSSKVACG